MLNPTLVAAISADYAGLLSLFVHKLGDRALAEDLIQQAFAESLQQLARDRIADPGRFSGYVYRVAFNLLRNHKRLMDNRADVRADSATLEGLASDSSPVEQLCNDSVAAHVHRIVAGLPMARDREIIRRFYLEEQCKSTICRDLGLSPLNFDRIVFRARRRIKALMAARGIQQSDLLRSTDPGRRQPARCAAQSLS